ncbi:amino acid transporter [Plakobranchus ocellatus]|uniref:Amino acid transporter n=1 Tax=Plakobranchus ocellatus TaxID=259542 RepID=A0AAV4BW87_9GAST|nr:amino acid transporter [Plakobranchus ocellatus]
MQSSRIEMERTRKSADRVKSCLKENSLILLTLIGIAVGFALGLGLQKLDSSPDLLQWTGLPGELFLRGLKATIVPIVVCMVITGEGGGVIKVSQYKKDKNFLEGKTEKQNRIKSESGEERGKKEEEEEDDEKEKDEEEEKKKSEGR